MILENNKHLVINGDSRNMSIVPSESVHLIVTSPPYWQVKDYGTDAQIGFHDTYAQYINNLNVVWSECHRVLHSGCRLCINIGDQFIRASQYGRFKIIPIRTEITRFCETIGFDYMGAVIWQKVGTSNSSGGAAFMGSFPYPRDGAITIDYEFILIFKKQGVAPKPTVEQKELSKLTTEEWKECFSGHWNFTGVRQTEHPAMYPEKLPSRLIKMFSFIGETVLDPFLGSGTTSLAAKKLSRNSIGYEINPEFITVINNKLSEPSINFSDCGLHEVINTGADPLGEVSFDSLPYLFTDPNILIKKDGEVKPPAAKDFHTVHKVINSTTFRLSNQMVVKLIGIAVPEELEQRAVKFLMEEVGDKQVAIKFDPIKCCSNGIRYCYLYLKNKTLINTHMIRNEVAVIDLSVDFKFREDFKVAAQEVLQAAENLWQV